MSELKPEDRTWETGEADAAIADLRQGIERLREHVKVFRAVTTSTAKPTDDEGQEAP